MFKNIKLAIDDICMLSNKREQERQAGAAEPVPADVKLREYVDNLDFETIKVIQTIMYIGRDGDERTNNPVEIYINARSSFELDGWNTKEIETNQMLNKTPLHEYLKEGCKLLNI